MQKLYQSKFHHTPTYVIVSSSPNLYTMAAIDAEGTHIGTGTSTTKKQAEQLAAKDAIKNLN